MGQQHVPHTRVDLCGGFFHKGFGGLDGVAVEVFDGGQVVLVVADEKGLLGLPASHFQQAAQAVALIGFFEVEVNVIAVDVADVPRGFRLLPAETTGPGGIAACTATGKTDKSAVGSAGDRENFQGESLPRISEKPGGQNTLQGSSHPEDPSQGSRKKADEDLWR